MSCTWGKVDFAVVKGFSLVTILILGCLFLSLGYNEYNKPIPRKDLRLREGEFYNAEQCTNLTCTIVYKFTINNIEYIREYVSHDEQFEKYKYHKHVSYNKTNPIKPGNQNVTATLVSFNNCKGNVESYCLIDYRFEYEDKIYDRQYYYNLEALTYFKPEKVIEFDCRHPNSELFRGKDSYGITFIIIGTVFIVITIIVMIQWCVRKDYDNYTHL